ncbi:hypothetical protein EJP02_086 [Escherichia phage EJP2]|nr:hypothetical protein EJP02_086 [Escherichia phage EJP2]
MINSNTYMRYLRMGVSLVPVRGKDSVDQEFAYAMPIDGVQYVLNDGGMYEDTNESEDMSDMLQNLLAVVNSDRHDKVKRVTTFLEKNLHKTVWCEIASGPQLGLLFGNADGTICQLAMDFRSPEQFQEYRASIIEHFAALGLDESKIPEISPMDTFVLIPESPAFEALFSTFQCLGIEVSPADVDDEE